MATWSTRKLYIKLLEVSQADLDNMIRQEVEETRSSKHIKFKIGVGGSLEGECGIYISQTTRQDEPWTGGYRGKAKMRGAALFLFDLQSKYGEEKGGEIEIWRGKCVGSNLDL